MQLESYICVGNYSYNGMRIYVGLELYKIENYWYYKDYDGKLSFFLKDKSEAIQKWKSINYILPLTEETRLLYGK